MSEPNGFFRSDNLVSNEDTFQYVIPRLTQIVKPGGVYLGVGPDQNFTYIVALQPRIAFITDIRRGNLHAHLMYKALFELSADRAEFLSRLFSRAAAAGGRAGVHRRAALRRLRDGRVEREALRAEPAGDPRPAPAQARVPARPGGRVRHRLRLLGVLRDGAVPGLLQRRRQRPARGSRYPTYQDLQMADDGRGVQRGYLAKEAHFKWVKMLQQNNLVVPLVGDFAGPKALRAVGAWVRERGATVTTFYTSNVEQYLFQSRVWDAFARNIASLPLDPTSTLLRSCFNIQCQLPAGARSLTLLDSMQALVRDHQAGRVSSYVDVLSRTR